MQPGRIITIARIARSRAQPLVATLNDWAIGELGVATAGNNPRIHHLPKSRTLKADERIAGIIHELAVTPPAKSVAEVKAASDVLEANMQRPPGDAGRAGKREGSSRKQD